ncbi:MAG TPA: cell division protein FtsZ [Candidatus Pacearchaeota archaeon]|nr:cell division protein FtsZ [Candidatus Pacearchaeota archaeon]HRR94851.1 cell division protein FtsZ [Candidatus Paceibacterota bacterium]HPC30628.1 cell division protein FtsZ [Candidatus Pacearchaeota archaeon]HQG09343.1 cell division protein FtsZ [Candidatus Pacearchaeota archaeon]HQH20261.1 cell division protein FtsZ [Candidatus Pacearchaeota archaeon]
MKKKSLTVKKNNSVKLAQRGISKKKTKNNPVKNRPVSISSKQNKKQNKPKLKCNQSKSIKIKLNNFSQTKTKAKNIKPSKVQSAPLIQSQKLIINKNNINNKKDINSEDNNETIKKIKIRIFGVGGGGGNIVAEISKKLKDFSFQKIDFIVANTDNQALSFLSKNIKKIPFGQKLTRGLGTGRDVLLGEKAAREDLEKIKSLFNDERDLYIVISSLGGGTGTGATPVFVKSISDLGIPVLGIFTLPFAFEGKKKMTESEAALGKMKEYLNAYMVLPNEKIFSLAKGDVSFTDSLNLLNNRLAVSLEGLLRTIYSPGLINIDWADIKTILEGKKKIAYLNAVKGKIGQNLDEFIKSIFKNPILESQFSNADNVLFNIEGSKDISLQVLTQISEKINELSPNARIIFGLNQNQKMKNEIKVTILATTSEEKKSAFKNKKKAPLTASVNQVNQDKNKEKIKIPMPSKENEKIENREKDIENDNLENIYNNEKEDAGEQEIRRTALEIKEAERQKLAEEEEKEKIYEIPAFLRKNKKLKK